MNKKVTKRAMFNQTFPFCLNWKKLGDLVHNYELTKATVEQVNIYCPTMSKPAVGYLIELKCNFNEENSIICLSKLRLNG